MRCEGGGAHRGGVVPLKRHSDSVMTSGVRLILRSTKVEESVWRETAYHGGAGTVPTP